MQVDRTAGPLVSFVNESNRWHRPGSHMIKAYDYRLSHIAPGYGAYYSRTFESGYYGALWVNVEQPLLENVLRPLAKPGLSCLDFACGTGRITRVAAKFFDHVVGVDVSAEMLKAASVPQNVRLVQCDLTIRSLGDAFDVATAFRFFLNAGDELRRDSLRALRCHLKPGGKLICNIHMNATAPAGLVWRLIHRLQSRTPRHTMGISAFSDILRQEGFTVKKVIPYGFLPRPGTLAPALCARLVEPVENLAHRIKLPMSLAEQFLVIAVRQ